MATATTATEKPVCVQAHPVVPGRLASLDAFRGITIAGMILVNTPGSWSHVYAPLRHAAWHWWTPTDLVFPFFLFITGCASWYSFRKFGPQQSSNALGKTVRRAALIFLVGLALNAFPFAIDYSELRIPGVLQRIALAWGLAVPLCLYFSQRRLIAVSAGILLGYWAVLLAFGGGDPYALETNFARRVDLWLLGSSHVYHGFGVDFDPEGLLSTFPAVVTVILGYLAGRTIGTSGALTDAVRSLLIWGAVGIAAGLAWGLIFPINKPLWTSSYVLLTGGLAAVLLAIVLYLMDVRRRTRWAMPFVVFGLNPLFAYVLSIVLAKVLGLIPVTASGTSAYGWLYTRIFEPLAGPINGSLLFAITIVAVCWLVVYVLYRRRVFIKL